MRKKHFLTVALAAALIAELAASAHMAWASGRPGVPADTWYAPAVAYCREHGLMNDTGAGGFSPDAPVTMGMAVTALYRLAGAEAAVPDGAAWYAAPAAWAAQEGIVDGSFDPEAAVSRETLAVLLWRGHDSPDAAAETGFADEADISREAVRAVSWIRAEGIMVGEPGNVFVPARTATRAEAAAVLMRCGERERIESAMDAICGASGAAAMPDGSLLVTDVYNRVIWRVADGAGTVYAGSETPKDIYGQPQGGGKDGRLDESTFRTPWAIAPYRDGWAVSDAENGAVRLLTPSGVQTLRFNIELEYPTGLAAGSGGDLYVADTHKGIIFKLDAQGEASIVARKLEDPMGLCWAGGALYAAETGRHRVVKIGPDGAAVPVAGSGTEGCEDGPAAQAQFSCPQGVAVGENGEIYIADTANSAVRRVRDGQVDTLAARDPTAEEGTLFSPTGLLVRGDTLYVCDSFAKKVFAIPCEGW